MSTPDDLSDLLCAARKFAEKTKRDAARNHAFVVAQLKARVIALEDQVTTLESALGLDFWGDPEWGLTATEHRLLALLVRHKIMTFDLAMTTLYADRPNPPTDRIITVYICKLREKMSIRIVALRGLGYSLSHEDRAALLERAA